MANLLAMVHNAITRLCRLDHCREQVRDRGAGADYDGGTTAACPGKAECHERSATFIIGESVRTTRSYHRDGDGSAA